MTKSEFISKIEKLEIPQTIYSLEGKLIPSGIVMDKIDESIWKVFRFDERGNYNEEETFKSEDKVNEYMYELLFKTASLLQTNASKINNAGENL